MVLTSPFVVETVRWTLRDDGLPGRRRHAQGQQEIRGARLRVRHCQPGETQSWDTERKQELNKRKSGNLSWGRGDGRGRNARYAGTQESRGAKRRWKNILRTTVFSSSLARARLRENREWRLPE